MQGVALKGTDAQPAASAVQYSVIVPCYNEADNVAVLTWLLRDALGKLNVSWEVVFVDDASPDGTAAAVLQLQVALGPELVRLVRRPAKLGLGSAYASGLAEARGQLIVLMDAGGTA
jgi:dolichol-phosphate mannosyltransferase